jgi:hypothetical protein
MRLGPASASRAGGPRLAAEPPRAVSASDDLQADQAFGRSGGSLPSLKPGEILGAGALAECFTGCWGDGFGRVFWLGFPCAEPAIFVEPMLLAIVVSPRPRRPETYDSFASFAAWARGTCLKP